MMMSESSAPVRTFSVGFREAAYDELPQARRVAHALGTEHTELVLTPEEALGVIERLPQIYDEPFADSSQIPTFLVSQFARRHVKVAISGDGGDELFGGYNRYLWLPRIWRALGAMPSGLRQRAAAAIRGVAPAAWDRAYAWIDPALPRWLRARVAGDKLHKLGRVLEAGSPAQSYLAVCSQWLEPLELVPRAVRESQCWTSWEFERHSPREDMMLHDLGNYLPDDILTKVDRASMAVGLEVRVPLLDHRVVEFAWSLPMDQKIARGQGKAPLRALLRERVPADVLAAPKSGFGVPLGAWLRGPLRAWAEDFLAESSLKQMALLRAAPIREAWSRHLGGNVNAEHALWPVIMYCQWARAYGVSA
jgi:asparagine synthase (glutamine-hydrolysing)